MQTPRHGSYHACREIQDVIQHASAHHFKIRRGSLLVTCLCLGPLESLQTLVCVCVCVCAGRGDLQGRSAGTFSPRPAHFLKQAVSQLTGQPTQTATHDLCTYLSPHHTHTNNHTSLHNWLTHTFKTITLPDNYTKPYTTHTHTSKSVDSHKDKRMHANNKDTESSSRAASPARLFTIPALHGSDAIGQTIDETGGGDKGVDHKARLSRRFLGRAVFSVGGAPPHTDTDTDTDTIHGAGRMVRGLDTERLSCPGGRASGGGGGGGAVIMPVNPLFNPHPRAHLTAGRSRLSAEFHRGNVANASEQEGQDDGGPNAQGIGPQGSTVISRLGKGIARRASDLQTAVNLARSGQAHKVEESCKLLVSGMHDGKTQYKT